MATRTRTPLILAGLLATALYVQAQPAPFTLRVQVGQDVQNVADGGAIAMSAEAVGLAAAASVTVTYRGTTRAVFNSFDLTGSLDFSITGLPEAPITLEAGESFVGIIRFQPTTSNRALSRLTMGFTEGVRTASLSLNLTGVAPEFVFSYTPQGGNATPLATGGAIQFPLTAVDATTTATVVISNRGSGPGVVNSIAAAGAAFQLIGLPLPGAAVDGTRELRFTVSFTPRQLETSTGTLTIELIDRRVVLALQGSGSGPLYAYDVVSDAGASVVRPAQLITLPDTTVGEKSTVMVRVRNTGNADGRITAISVSGAGFQLSELPFLPLTLLPGGTSAFSVNFSPTQSGRVAGRLKIGNDEFDLAASGMGPVLAYSYIVGTVTTTVAGGGSLNFTPAAVGGASSLRFQISNTGTASGSVGSISITTVTTVYTLSGLPAVPFHLAPGASAGFTVSFVPTALGAATATLRVDNLTFTLNGTGTSPVPLPGYRFEGASGAQQPLQQPAVGLALDSSYPLPLTGVLTLAFNSEVFANDPTVQFATGGRTINFSIASNSRQAVFANGATQVRIQTGTVAGNITLTPSFVTEGGLNLTPVSPLAQTLSVAQSAPVLLNVTISGRTQNTLTLLVSGFATSRSVTQMDLQFTIVSGENVGTPRVTVNVEPSFLAWYQSGPALTFGSLFTATVPINFQGDVKNVTNPVDAVESVAVTLSNRMGTSAPRTLALK